MYFFIALDLLFIAISIPLLLEKIGPNQWYGFRVEKTLDNREIWFKANKYMAKALIIVSCIHIIYVFIAAKISNPIYGNATIFTLVFGVLIVVIASMLYLRKL